MMTPLKIYAICFKHSKIRDCRGIPGMVFEGEKWDRKIETFNFFFQNMKYSGNFRACKTGRQDKAWGVSGDSQWMPPVSRA
jgi:hypothetical protein